MKSIKELVKQYQEIVFNFFNKGHQRTLEAKKNIAASFFIKGISIVINLALVPLTINYVNPSQYGIWLTLSSIVAWFSFFDIGFGHGLRNRFAEAKAKGDFEKARIYVSTTYAVLALIFLSVWLLFFMVNFFVDWSIILNAPTELAQELSTLALIVFSFFCLQIVLKTINTIIIADQKPAKAAFFDMLGQLIALVTIFILTKTTKGSLIYLGLGLGSAPIIMLMVSSLIFYSKSYKYFAPSLKYVKFSHAKDIMKLGFNFFFIQIAVIIIYQTNNLIITQTGSPEDVTIFNIAYKYLSIALMGFSIILGPFWSAFTEAYTKKDYLWMKTTLKNLKNISYLAVFGVIILVLFSKYIYQLWIGDTIIIPLHVTIVVGFYIILLIVVALYTQILNGIGKIKIQLLSYSIATIFHIPLAIFLGNKWGIIGVILSASFFYFIISIYTMKQVNLIVRNKAKGIWIK
ncbi:oligosaccharide flippase family protein [Gaetbulibacter aquiaggeris]|uniref:Oligosaccharide flippase family protein n=1 Tax=Gaetbulibacter aquiaggeris TaxID=1735373 RepID=A0ABW7MRR3_9FLAO